MGRDHRIRGYEERLKLGLLTLTQEVDLQSIEDILDSPAEAPEYRDTARPSVQFSSKADKIDTEWLRERSKELRDWEQGRGSLVAPYQGGRWIIAKG